jgi:site-specific recombinase XerC
MTREAERRQWTRTPTVSEFDQLLRQYRDHLTRERGLAAPTVAGYQTVARQFVAHVASSTGFDLACLDAVVVSQFVVRAGQTRCT